jgi:hypothetical protein
MGRFQLLRLQAERDRKQLEQLQGSELEQLEQKLAQGVETFMDHYVKFMMYGLIPGGIIFMVLQ